MFLNMFMRMNAMTRRHDAEWNMVRNSMAMMDMCNAMPSFGGNLQSLHQIETQMALDNMKNQTAYQIACAQEKAAEQRIAQQMQQKGGFNLIA